MFKRGKSLPLCSFFQKLLAKKFPSLHMLMFWVGEISMLVPKASLWFFGALVFYVTFSSKTPLE